jgi:hypothetical protein
MSEFPVQNLNNMSSTIYSSLGKTMGLHTYGSTYSVLKQKLRK